MAPPPKQLPFVARCSWLLSRLSTLSALRLPTLVPELVVNGGFPAPAVSCSGVAPAAVEGLLTWSADEPSVADTLVFDVALLLWPRMKLPPVAASAIPP